MPPRVASYAYRPAGSCVDGGCGGRRWSVSAPNSGSTSSVGGHKPSPGMRGGSAGRTSGCRRTSTTPTRRCAKRGAVRRWSVSRSRVAAVGVGPGPLLHASRFSTACPLLKRWHTCGSTTTRAQSRPPGSASMSPASLAPRSRARTPIGYRHGSDDGSTEFVEITRTPA